MSDAAHTVLSADIGGSNTRLALATVRAGAVILDRREQFENASVTSLADLIRRYLADRPLPTHACLAVAGPTDGRTVQLTNLDWVIDAERLGREFGFPFRLVNDFEAVAWGLDALEAAKLVTLQAGIERPAAPRIALGPGTGLGVAISADSGAGYRPLPGEGGHVGFAPTDAEQAALLASLQKRFGRVSVERILSGPGIAELYAFCRSSTGRPVEREYTAAEVTGSALDGSDAAAVKAIRLFCRILGQTAGDLALVAGARGGVFLAGGIPPRILPLLQDGGLLAGFLGKGRFTDWMKYVPLYVVTDPDIGLKGAALAAGKD